MLKHSFFLPAFNIPDHLFFLMLQPLQPNVVLVHRFSPNTQAIFNFLPLSKSYTPFSAALSACRCQLQESVQSPAGRSCLGKLQPVCPRGGPVGRLQEERGRGTRAGTVGLGRVLGRESDHLLQTVFQLQLLRRGVAFDVNTHACVIGDVCSCGTCFLEGG